MGQRMLKRSSSIGTESDGVSNPRWDVPVDVALGDMVY